MIFPLQFKALGTFWKKELLSVPTLWPDFKPALKLSKGGSANLESSIAYFEVLAVPMAWNLIYHSNLACQN